MANLEKFRALKGQKCFVETYANEFIHMKLVEYNQDILTFRSIDTGIVNVPIRNLIRIETTPFKLPGGAYWSD